MKTFLSILLTLVMTFASTGMAASKKGKKAAVKQKSAKSMKMPKLKKKHKHRKK